MWDGGVPALPAAQGTDVSQVVSVLVPKLAPGDSATVAFAVLVAHTLAELQAAAQVAASTYQQALPTLPTAGYVPGQA